MNHVKKYKIIISTCLLLCLPVGIWLWIMYGKWKKNNTEQSSIYLEKNLINGLSVVFMQLIIICFLFYHFGRNFIEVMGTFY